MNAHLQFHHFGLAVRKPEPAQAFLSALGYEIGEAVYDPIQCVNLALCIHATEPAVEIIWPGDAKAPIDALIQKHASGIIYHLCYTTDALPAAIAEWEKTGLTVVCISPPNPAPLFGNRKVSFYNILGMGLIEILE